MNKKLLIVDDEPDIHMLLKLHLKKLKDIEILSAYSAEEAVKIYEELLRKREKPSLVVMDLNLLGEEAIEKKDRFEGLQATKKILKLDPEAVIWGYTAWEDTKEGKKLKEIGAKKVFSRSTSFKEFADIVKNFLNKNS